MAQHEAAVAVAEAGAGAWAPWAALFATVMGALAKFGWWDRRKSSRDEDEPSTHQLVQKMATDIAVIQATMATKEDLNNKATEMIDKTRVMVEAVHDRLSEHIRDHITAA